MFEQFTAAPPDPILGLAEAYRSDPNPLKVNLGVGVYQDEQGRTPIPRAVKTAEAKLLREEATKSYLPIGGTPEFAAATQSLLFGVEHEVVASGRATTAHTPGGTGALRVAANFLADKLPGRSVWVSDPTWPNHLGVFRAAGLTVKTYPYFDAASNALDFAALRDVVAAIPAGDVLLLHGCCHNPTGIDPTLEQWQELGDLVRTRGLLPLVDLAYQGLGDGLEEDAAGLRALVQPGDELLIASSYSKNFGLYRERVGALTLVAASNDDAVRTMSHVRLCVRTDYSNPPAHGGAIVTTVLNDPELRKDWLAELAEMRARINGMRSAFVAGLHEAGVGRDFSFLARQRGMFSFSGLTPTQVDALRERYAIYAVRSGRINVAGITPGNLDYLCKSVAPVLADVD